MRIYKERQINTCFYDHLTFITENCEKIFAVTFAGITCVCLSHHVALSLSSYDEIHRHMLHLQPLTDTFLTAKGCLLQRLRL